MTNVVVRYAPSVIPSFHISDDISKQIVVSKMEKGKIRDKGYDVISLEDVIEISMEDYIDILKNIDDTIFYKQ